MTVDYTIDGDERELLSEWLAEHNETCQFADPYKTGAIGERLTFLFTPTSIGTFCSVRCACGEEFCLNAGTF